MKFSKQQEKQVESIMKLSDYLPYAEASLRLTELTDQFKERNRNLADLKLRSPRFGSDVRNFIGKQSIVLPTSAEALDMIARAVMRGGALAEEMLEARNRACSDLYSRLRFNSSEDLGFVKQLDDARAAVMILERAVALQKTEVATQKQAAIRQVVQSLQPKRLRIAREIADKMMAFRTALREERALAESLDPELLNQLRPGIFPLNVFLDDQIIQWIGEAQAAGVIAYTRETEQARESAAV